MRVHNICRRVVNSITKNKPINFTLSTFLWNNPFLLNIFREALERGVYSDKALRDRYFHVESVAKRTALIKNENASLFMYLLSYLQSLVMFAPNTEKVGNIVLNNQMTLLLRNVFCFLIAIWTNISFFRSFPLVILASILMTYLIMMQLA